MAQDEPNEILAEPLEFDLDGILNYASIVQTLPIKQTVPPELSTNDNKFQLILRNVSSTMASPVEIDGNVVRQFEGNGIIKKQSSQGESFVFSTKAIEIKPALNNDLLIQIYSKAKQKYKRQILFSFNILDSTVRDPIVTELRFIGSKLKRCGNHAELSDFTWNLELNPETQTITSTISYSVLLNVLLNRFFSSDVVAMFDDILRPMISQLPIEPAEMKLHSSHLPIDVHLFYRAMAEHTKRLPDPGPDISHPYITSKLYPFQRKTVNWLLKRERMEFDPKKRICDKMPLVNNETLSLLKSFPHCDSGALNKRIAETLDEICFGWKRIVARDLVCWYNNYTGNIMSEAQMIDCLFNLNTSEKFIEVGGCGYLCEEMGLGKTVEIISLIIHNQRPDSDVGRPISLQFNEESDVRICKRAKTTLIAAPESIIKQWYTEIGLMCPYLLVTIYRGLNQYPELRNIPKYTAEFLQRYDVVLMTYSVMSYELDFAVYSSQRASTRGSRKRRGNEAESTNNGPSKEPVDISQFQAQFEAPLSLEMEEITFNKKKFDRANLDDLGAKARKEYPGDVPHTLFYDSPLMMCHWWRVVLDEVQMVAAGANRAFKTASMIPRVHSWGVSGTPVRLNSVLEFLKVSPFYYPTSAFCWKKLNNEENNLDFVSLWQTIALRHTKAMVHNDINLPPQERILLSLPFTELEQDAYDQLFASSLAHIGLHKDEIPKDLALSTRQCQHLRSCLPKLRQLCGNNQIGKLSSVSTGRGKNKRKLIFATQAQLKTLESVLEDMIASVMDEIWDAEKLIINRSLDICQVLENSLLPEKVVEILTFLLEDVLYIITKLESTISTLQFDIRTSQKLVTALNPDKIKDHGQESDDNDDDGSSEEESENEKPLKKKHKSTEHKSEQETIMSSANNLKEAHDANKVTERKDNDTEMNDNQEKEFAFESSKLLKLKEKLSASRVKLRPWKVIEHKCYFLLASAHFQLYDLEYQAKIKELGVSFDLAERIGLILYGYALGSRKTLPRKTNFLDSFVKIEGQTLEEEAVAKHKYLEGVFYAKAEAKRNEILSQPLKEFQELSHKKLEKAKIIDPTSLINDGNKVFSKTTRHLLLTYPSLDVEDLVNLAWNHRIRDVIDQYVKIASQLNGQAEFINELLGSLKELLLRPLLSAEESPDGEEYGQSIEDQDKAATLMLVIAQLIRDRTGVCVEGHAKTIAIRQKQDDIFSTEAHQITDQKYLKALQKKRANLVPNSDSTIEELFRILRVFQLEYSQRNEYLDVMDEIIKRFRVTADNEKTCQNLMQRQLNTVFNPVFNSRVEYFKQLQQISDTVQNSAYPYTHTDLDGDKITGHLKFHLDFLSNVNNSLLRLASRQGYLDSLVRVDHKEGGKREDKEASLDETICLICQGEIIVGSLAPCGHRFCKLCLNEWLYRSPTCPLCKSYTNRESIYNFTLYRADIKAEKVPNLHINLTNNSDHDELHQVYKTSDPATLKKIQNIQLDNSYGSKVDLIVKQVLYLKSVDSEVQIVIFSQWQDLLLILAYAFDQARITHVTAKSHLGLQKKKEDNPAEQFKKKENGITCFLLNAQIQASGLTLVNASHIFLCEPLINTPTELQAISRIHRIGQDKVTTVWMFTVQNTIEDNIVALGTNKRLQFLRANAKEAEELDSRVLGINGNSEDVTLEAENLLTAELEAMSYGTAEGKKSLYNTENVDDKDIPFVYFGERVDPAN